MLIPALSFADRLSCIDHQKQDAGVLPFGGSHAMGNKDSAREPDQVVAVMSDISDDCAGFGQAISRPVGLASVQGHDRPRDLRTGCTCSWARIQSWTDVRR